jgi:phospholipid/cholesterol/gamma-HCH transport system permease protein
MVPFLGRIGRYAIDQIAGMGRMFVFLISAIVQAFRAPAKLRLIVYHIKTIGVDSLSVVALSGFFTGMVMGFQGYYSLRQFNAESWLGSATALSLLRELGPVLSAFMVTGRTGSAMAAELGTMRATEQIDALYSMAINPIKYLVTPRIVASLIAMPMLTAIFNVIGIFGSYAVGVGILGVSSGSFFPAWKTA